MPHPLAVAVTAMILAVAGCGNDGPNEPPTVHALAAKLGCTYRSEAGDLFVRVETMYVREGGQCGPYGLYTFTGPDTRDLWLSVAQHNGTGAAFVVGDTWAVRAGTPAQAQRARRRVGGVVR